MNGPIETVNNGISGKKRRVCSCFRYHCESVFPLISQIQNKTCRLRNRGLINNRKRQFGVTKSTSLIFNFQFRRFFNYLDIRTCTALDPTKVLGSMKIKIFRARTRSSPRNVQLTSRQEVPKSVRFGTIREANMVCKISLGNNYFPVLKFNYYHNIYINYYNFTIWTFNSYSNGKLILENIEILEF